MRWNKCETIAISFCLLHGQSGCLNFIYILYCVSFRVTSYHSLRNNLWHNSSYIYGCMGRKTYSLNRDEWFCTSPSTGSRWGPVLPDQYDWYSSLHLYIKGQVQQNAKDWYFEFNASFWRRYSCLHFSRKLRRRWLHSYRKKMLWLMSDHNFLVFPSKKKKKNTF